MKANREDPYDAGHMLDTQEGSSRGTNHGSVDLESQHHVRVAPPFPNLKSLLATAVVLSFFGNRDEVKHLMRNLSKKTREYIEKNQLKGFVMEPRLRGISTKLNIFHRKIRGESFRFPDDETL